jgi:arylsulfatase A-like enzyme
MRMIGEPRIGGQRREGHPGQRASVLLLARSAVAASVAFVCIGCSAPPPLNVVLIVVDDLGWADTGVYGSSFYETPNIDRLASEGVRFSQFYTASPVCSPTRASLMSGRHPARLDLTNWIGGEQNGLLNQADYIRALPLEEVTVGEAFRAQGYATGYVGKWHLGPSGSMPDDQGFDYMFAVNEAGQPGSYHPPYENLNFLVTNVPDLENDPADAYLTDRLTDASVDFLDQHQGEPFFFVLSHYAVHTPLEARPDLLGPYEAKAVALGPSTDEHFATERDGVTKLRQDHATYAAMIQSTDESVGRIMAKLAELGIEDHTAVVFVSDNGGLSTLARPRSFNHATSNMPLRAGKGWLYEGGIRAPLLVSWPGAQGAAPLVLNTPAMSTDLYPTLLEMAGLEAMPSQHLDGVSLVGSMREEASEERPALYWHFPHYHGSGNRPGGAVREGDLKLIEWFEDGAIELYDLGADLSERRDLAEERPAEAARLLARLQAWRAELGANMPSEPAG